MRYAARLAAGERGDEAAVVNHVLPLLARLNMEVSPPENAVLLYAGIAQVSGCSDPFLAIKKESSDAAQLMRRELAEVISGAEDPLRMAFSLAIAGNVIDYGSSHDLELKALVSTILNRGIVHDQYTSLATAIDNVPGHGFILYLADNCGELVFDGLVIELLAEMGKRVVLGLRGGPIINDAQVADARACGLDRYCQLVSNGTSCPGTPVDSCSPEFQKYFSAADLIISKGQGNFETLSDVAGPIYFLLTVKCAVVAAHLDQCVTGDKRCFQVGDTVLVQRRGLR